MIEQTKTKPLESLEYKKDKQMQPFSFSPPINLVEERKLLLAVTSFEASNSVFNITDKNNSFSISIPGRCGIPKNLENGINDELKKLLKLKFQNYTYKKLENEVIKN